MPSLPDAIDRMTLPREQSPRSIRVARLDILHSSLTTMSVRPELGLRCALGLIVFATALHLAYLLFACPFDLSPDEAHYWHWSRHLDWAYYSKGPLVAWLIRCSCDLFGSLSVSLTGSEAAAVRLPAVLCHAILLGGLYTLTAETLRSTRQALAVVALAFTLPPLSAGAVLMTIDAPFLACWCWALVFVWRALERGGLGWWCATGACAGLGVLAKAPMLLFPVAVAAYLASERTSGRHLRQLGFWLMITFMGVGCFPVLIWNAGHDWVSVRHVLEQVGIGRDATAHVVRWAPLAFLGGQFGFLIGFWFLAFLAAAWTYRPKKRTGTFLEKGFYNKGACPLFLWWLSVPVWAVFLIAGLYSAGQANWPAASYIAGFPLAVAWIHRQLMHPLLLYRRITSVCLVWAVGFGLVLSFAIHFPGLYFRPLLAAFVPPPSEDHPTPLRRVDPTCRLDGWRTLAAEVDAIRDRVRVETGAEAVLTGMAWTLPGEMSFYCRGHPNAYSLGLALADRHSQYDLWRPNPVQDAQAFHGRTFVYVGEEIPNMGEIFDRVELPLRVTHRAEGRPVAEWVVWVGHGFRGFPRSRTFPVRAGY